MKLWKKFVSRIRARLVAWILPEIVPYVTAFKSEVDVLRRSHDDLAERIRDITLDLHDMADRVDDLPESVLSEIGERMREVFR